MRKAATRSSSSPELATRAAPPPPDMSDTAPLGVDDALERAGGWSTFQWRLMGALGACTSSAATHMLQPIFLVPLMDWPDVSSVQVGLTSSLFFAGYAVGVFAWAAYSDGRGRRPTILASFLVGNLGGIGSFFAPTFHTFLALRCLCGFGVGGLKNAVFLLGTEFAPPAARAQVSALVSYFWLGGLLWLVGVAYLLQEHSWRYLGLAHIPALLVQALIVQPAYLPESPRFLLVAGEVERAKLVVRQARRLPWPPPPLRVVATSRRRSPCRRRRVPPPLVIRSAHAVPALSQVFKANGAPPPEPLCLQQPAASGASHSTIAQLWRKGTRRATAVIGFSQGVCTMTVRRRRRQPPPPPPPLPPPSLLLHHLLVSRYSFTQSRSPRSSTS